MTRAETIARARVERDKAEGELSTADGRVRQAQASLERACRIQQIANDAFWDAQKVLNDLLIQEHA